MSVARKLWSLHPQQGTVLMNTRVDLKKHWSHFGSHCWSQLTIILYCWKWKEERCPVRSAITSQTRKKRREFNLGRSVSHGQSGPCACQRLGERGVNHDVQLTSWGLQVWLFKHPVNRNIVDVKEKVSDIVRRPCEDTKQVFFIWQI